MTRAEGDWSSDLITASLPARSASWIAPKIDRGYPINAIVERVKGEHLPDAMLGLVMRLNMEGEEPELSP